MSLLPGKNSVAVAELAFGLIALDRRIVRTPEPQRDVWNKGLRKARGLLGRTLRLVGVGGIDEDDPRARAFGMPVVAGAGPHQKAQALGIDGWTRPSRSFRLRHRERPRGAEARRRKASSTRSFRA